MTRKKRTALIKQPKDSSTAPQTSHNAVPPPDDPLRRATEFDPNREYKSKEMARKRLEAIEHTKAMPTSQDESPKTDSSDSPQSDSE